MYNKIGTIWCLHFPIRRLKEIREKQHETEPMT